MVPTSRKETLQAKHFFGRRHRAKFFSNRKMVPSGGDWATIAERDMLRLDARITEEGAEIYFRTTPMFDTDYGRYLWLNDIVAVELDASAVRYNMSELL